jgi:hypothetical protein
MTEQPELDKEKMELLKLARQELREDIMMRREWEFRMFSWVTAGLLAAIGFIAQTLPKGLDLPVLMRVVLATIVAIVLFLVVRYIWQNRQIHDEGARTVVKVNELFHYWEEGYFTEKETLYLPGWRGWGSGKSWTSHWGTYSVMFILGLLGLVVVVALIGWNEWLLLLVILGLVLAFALVLYFERVNVKS